MAFLNLFAAFSTTSDKRKVLQMVDAFLYNVLGSSQRGGTWWSFLLFSTTRL